MIKPFFKNKQAIVFSVDNNIHELFTVALMSLVKHTEYKNNYDVVVIQKNLKEENKESYKKLVQNKDNISLRFLDITPVISKYDSNIFHTYGYYTEAAYYRLFIPELFKEYEKIAYLDSDTSIHFDIAKLFEINLEDKYICATKDIGFQFALHTNCQDSTKLIEYMKENKLGLKDYNNYFQSAMIIFDIKKIKNLNLVEKAIEELKRVGKPLFVEQCILNKIYENHVKFISYKYNYNVTWCDKMPLSVFFKLPFAIQTDLFLSKINPRIIHYTYRRPWQYSKPYKNHKQFFKIVKTLNMTKEITALEMASIKRGDYIFARKIQTLIYILFN